MAIEDVFDKIASGARNVANTVADTAGDVVNKGKRQVEISKIKGDLRETFCQLGEAVYGAEKGYENTGSKADLIAAIDGLNERLNALEDERAVEKEQKENERAQRAASKTDDGTIEIPLERQICPKCGAERVGNLKFCGNCGSQFAE